MSLDFLGQQLSLDFSSPQVMGILNVTPDSFSDGGKFTSIDNALAQVEQMIADGASLIDIGGESTRPGALAVETQEELTRVIPIVDAIKQRFDVVVSVDTSKAEVMTEAINCGADLINDVRALQEPNCLEVISQSTVPVCLMHMQGQPRTMQENPQYDDVICDISDFFSQRITACLEKGINKERIILDPGFGFGKTLQQNYQLLAHLEQFKQFNLAILSGTSRKSMLGNLLNRDVSERLSASISTALIAAQNGANIIRVHDVKETSDAIKILTTVNTYQ